MLIGLTGALLVIGALFLARDFHGWKGDGWALVGTCTLLAGGVFFLVLGALETAGLTGLLAAGVQGAAWPPSTPSSASPTS